MLAPQKKPRNVLFKPQKIFLSSHAFWKISLFWMFSNVSNFLEWCHYSHSLKSVVIYVFYRGPFLVILREKRSKYHRCWKKKNPPTLQQSHADKKTPRESYFLHQHFKICFSAVSSTQTRPSYLYCPGEVGREKVWRKGLRKNIQRKIGEF